MVSAAKRPNGRQQGWSLRHPTRRDGAIAIASLLLPGTYALVLHSNHAGIGIVTLWVAVALGLPVIWLGWATYRQTSRAARGGGDLDLAEVADQLAVAVGAQWEAEIKVRRLNEPYPLPVSWEAADPSLTDPWEVLAMLATTGAGWPAPPPPGTWARCADDLAGRGGELAHVLARVPTGRLVVLGEPGAGKTMLMVRLVLDLLKDRGSGEPVPVLVSLASWNPQAQDLHGWLGKQLTADHRFLASEAPGGGSLMEALLAARLILPILDGLDEIPDAIRGPAIGRINDALRPGERLVVTCRSWQYLDSVRPRAGIEATLRGAAAVELGPLAAETVRSYILHDARGAVAKARWEPVLAVLDSDMPIAQAIETPLMVGLACTIYNPRPGELVGALRQPDELCSPDLANRRAVESLLFDAFIPAAYRHGSRGRWNAHNAEKWLVFLARHLESTSIASPNLAWQQLPVTMVGAALAAAVMVGFLAGIVAGIVVGVTAGTPAGVVAGIGTGIVAGIVARVVVSINIRAATLLPEPETIILSGPYKNIDDEPRHELEGCMVLAGILAAGCIAGFAAAVVVGVVVGAVISAGAAAAVVAALVAGTGVGASVWAGAFSGGLWPPVATGSATSPRAELARDRRAAIAIGAIFGGLAGVGTGSLTGALAGLAAGITAGVSAGVLAAVGAIVAPAWPLYEMTRTWLALRGRLPWSLMGFLEDAHKRGVLRQAGAVYQFRHIELQHRLATRPSGPASKTIRSS